MRRALIAAALLAAAAAAPALDLSGSGLSLAGERVEEGRRYSVLADASGATLLFYAEAEPGPDRLAALASMFGALRSWQGFSAASVRAVNYADRLQVVAIPARFVVQGAELATAVPSGVQLFKSTAVEYDFKVKSGQSVVRVSGVYTGWEDLRSAALAAYRDPVAFMQARDPLYALRRIAELEAEVRAGAERIAALEARAALAGAARERADAAIIASLNGGKALDAAAVAKLVELKAADPGLDRARAAAALKAAGFALSAKEISVVYLVKFGER